MERTKVWPSHVLERMAVSDLREGDKEQLPHSPIPLLSQNTAGNLLSARYRQEEHMWEGESSKLSAHRS